MLHPMKSYWPLVASLLLAISASASTRIATEDAPSITDADYVNYAANFPSVGKLKGAFSGSGVLISDQWVLTAAHVADFSKSMTFTIGDHVVGSSEIIVHPDYQSFSSNHAYDLALVRLETAIGDITPAQLWEFSSPDGVLGREGSWVGYGQGGDGLTGAMGATYALRGFTNMIEYTGDEIGVTADAFVADFDRPDGSENFNEKSDPIPTALEGQLTPFDSGGGVFTQIGDFDYLIGINSFRGVTDGSFNSDYGDLSGAINLQPFIDWIETTTGVMAVPEPGHFAAIAALAMLGVVARRRRR